MATMPATAQEMNLGWKHVVVHVRWVELGLKTEDRNVVVRGPSQWSSSHAMRTLSTVGSGLMQHRASGESSAARRFAYALASLGRAG